MNDLNDLLKAYRKELSFNTEGYKEATNKGKLWHLIEQGLHESANLDPSKAPQFEFEYAIKGFSLSPEQMRTTWNKLHPKLIQISEKKQAQRKAYLDFIRGERPKPAGTRTPPVFIRVSLVPEVTDQSQVTANNGTGAAEQNTAKAELCEVVHPQRNWWIKYFCNGQPIQHDYIPAHTPFNAIFLALAATVIFHMAGVPRLLIWTLLGSFSVAWGLFFIYADKRSLIKLSVLVLRKRGGYLPASKLCLNSVDSEKAVSLWFDVHPSKEQGNPLIIQTKSFEFECPECETPMTAHVERRLHKDGPLWEAYCEKHRHRFEVDLNKKTYEYRPRIAS